MLLFVVLMRSHKQKGMLWAIYPHHAPKFTRNVYMRFCLIRVLRIPINPY